MEAAEVENTVRRLCAQANATRQDQRKFKGALIQLREFSARTHRGDPIDVGRDFRGVAQSLAFELLGHTL